MPERYHYSKLKHRLGDLSVVPNIPGLILTSVNFIFLLELKMFSFCNSFSRPIQHTQMSVIMVGIINFRQCKPYSWLEVLYSIEIWQLIHWITLIFIILLVEFLNFNLINMQQLVLWIISWIFFEWQIN